MNSFVCNTFREYRLFVPVAASPSFWIKVQLGS